MGKSRKYHPIRWHSLELGWKQLTAGQSRSPFSTLGRGLLRTVSYGYGLGVVCRNWAYDYGIRKVHRIDIPVISVGNVVLGGSGKTPIVELLARLLQENSKVAIVVRGYGGEVETHSEPLLVSRGEAPLVDPVVCGDEPYLLSSNLPGVIVVASPDRVAAARLAQDLGAELVILDDGFQHRRLRRDLDLVVTSHTSNQALFPRGPYRERGLSRADLVIGPGAHVEMERVSRELGGQLPGELTQLVDRRVGLFCGVGRPERFAQSVQDCGAVIIDRLDLPDHGVVSRQALKAFSRRCRANGAELLLCTQKDWVKLSKVDFSLPVAFLRSHMVVTRGLSYWHHFLSRARELLVRKNSA